MLGLFCNVNFKFFSLEKRLIAIESMRMDKNCCRLLFLNALSKSFIVGEMDEKITLSFHWYDLKITLLNVHDKYFELYSVGNVNFPCKKYSICGNNEHLLHDALTKLTMEVYSRVKLLKKNPDVNGSTVIWDFATYKNTNLPRQENTLNTLMTR